MIGFLFLWKAVDNDNTTKKKECKQVQIAVDKKGAKPLMINYRQMGQPRCV